MRMAMMVTDTITITNASTDTTTTRNNNNNTMYTTIVMAVRFTVAITSPVNLIIRMIIIIVLLVLISFIPLVMIDMAPMHCKHYSYGVNSCDDSDTHYYSQYYSQRRLATNTTTRPLLRLPPSQRPHMTATATRKHD